MDHTAVVPLDTLVRAEAVAQQAEKEGLDKQGDAPPSLALARLQILEQAAMTNFLKDHKATDAELKAEYDTQIAAMPKTQYKARHILVKTKEEAEKMRTEAESHAEEDRRRMEEVEARNRLDGIVYQAEKTIRENRDKLSESDVKQAEEALEEAKKAMNDGGVARLRSAT